MTSQYTSKSNRYSAQTNSISWWTIDYIVECDSQPETEQTINEYSDGEPPSTAHRYLRNKQFELYDENVQTTGVCGDYLTWSFDAYGHLHISGSGLMYDSDYLEIDNGLWNPKYIYSVTIDNGVESIGDFAFKGSQFKTIIIPASVNRIGNSPFIDSRLESIEFYGDAPSLHKWAFRGSDITVHYPSNNATWNFVITQNYGGNVNWVPDAVIPPERKRMILPSGITDICDEAFMGTDAEEYVLPNSVQTIGPRAFAELKAQNVRIVIPFCSVTIANDAFVGSDVVIITPAGSDASIWADAHNITRLEK